MAHFCLKRCHIPICVALRRETMAAYPPDYTSIVGTLSSNNLTSDQKKSIAMTTLNSLDMPAKKDVTVSTLASLDDASKKDVAARAGAISPPSQPMANVIWILIVTGFVLVLIGSSTLLLIGVIFLGKTADNVQVVVTVFTAVVAFLAGLVTPSPTQSTR
jgi:hypothetical protein